ncbi:MAG: hypothetical protein K2G55_17770 [Lachnospiraceae bacterium]|nr:hypothetical protein [Lachnospiraceae bacterium]MDE7204563.1 hypothetical protein [Lachnospiraceae bacterium]
MEVQTIEKHANKIVKEVMKKVHNKDYKGVEGVVDEIEIGIDDFIETMQIIEEQMMDPEDSIDEIADDVGIDFYEMADGSCYRSDHRLTLYGDEMFITIEFEFRITETGVKSILRGVNV